MTSLVEMLWMPLIGMFLTVASLHLLLDRGWAGWLALDKPNARSLHVAPTPRVGGLVLVPVALLVSLVTAQSPSLMLALAAGLCAVSFIDDRWGLPIILRLVSHMLVAVLLCSQFWSSLPLWTLGLAVISLVWAINLYNFMDGTDGLAGGMTLFGFTVFGLTILNIAPELANLAFCLAAAAAGFLMFNFSPARVFMGDAGSVSLGFLAGAVGLTGWLHEMWPLWFPVLVFSPFVADASVTLLKRVLRRDRFWQAHRDHYYQRLVRMGWSHRRLAVAEYALMAACGGSALALLRTDIDFQIVGLSLWVAAYSVLMLFIDRRWAKSQASHGDPA